MLKKALYMILVFLTGATLSASAGNKKSEKETTERFNRGIAKMNTVFIPKGAIGTGVSFSYSNLSLGNAVDDAGYSMLFSLIDDMQGSLTSFGVAPHISYFIADNLSLGLRFDYDRTNMGLGGARLSISDDLGFSLENSHYFKQSYMGALTLRNYIPFGQSKRFAMFAELRATGGYAQSETFKYEKPEGINEIDKFGTYQDIYNFEIGIVPGLIAFVTNEVALEVSVGLIGFNYQKAVQVTNQVERSEMEKTSASFKINLLSVNLGISFYIPTKGTKPAKI